MARRKPSTVALAHAQRRPCADEPSVRCAKSVEIEPTPSTSEGFPFSPSHFIPVAMNHARSSGTLLRGPARSDLRESDCIADEKCRRAQGQGVRECPRSPDDPKREI